MEEGFPLTKHGIRDLNKAFPLDPKEFVIAVATNIITSKDINHGKNTFKFRASFKKRTYKRNLYFPMSSA